MDDGTVSTCKVIAAVLWAWTLGLIVGAWLTAALGGELWVVGMLAATGCASSAVAAVGQIRCYSVSLCSQIRVLRAELNQHSPSRPAGSHDLRGL